jgi:predicted dinucleotide-utilizing enzyme
MRAGRYRTPGMRRDKHIDGLMEKLLKAIECSLAASQAARETIEEILKRGADTAIFFAGAADGKAPEGEEVQLTPQDREFLRTLSIRPDSA